MNSLFDVLKRRLERGNGLAQIADNMVWLFFDRFLRLGIGLLIGVWIARYLGPEQYGLFNYASAFVALFGAVAGMGLNRIVVRDLVRDGTEAGSILGTAFFIRMAGGVLAIILCNCMMAWLEPDDPLTRIIVAIMSVSLIFNAIEILKYWYESQVKSKYIVWVGNAVFLVGVLIKMVLILVHAPLMAFVWLTLLEGLLFVICLLGIYLKQYGKSFSWSVRLQRVGPILRDSWPLLLSGMAIMIYMRIDQIMLGEMLGNEAVGVYSAALRISEVWYMVPTIVSASLFPAIIANKDKGEGVYRERLQSLLNWMGFLAFLIAIIVSLSSGWIIDFLFDERFSEAGIVLAIHVWACIFVFQGVIGGQWFVLEKLQHLHLVRTLTGAFANIALNLLLIPRYGIVGAAVATVISQGLSAYLLDITSRKTFFIFKLKSRALFLGPVLVFFPSKNVDWISNERK